MQELELWFPGVAIVIVGALGALAARLFAPPVEDVAELTPSERQARERREELRIIGSLADPQHDVRSPDQTEAVVGQTSTDPPSSPPQAISRLATPRQSGIAQVMLTAAILFAVAGVLWATGEWSADGSPGTAEHTSSAEDIVEDALATVASSPGDITVALLASHDLIHAGSLDRARPLIEWVARVQPDDPEGLAHLGALLLYDERPTDALPILTRAVAGRPEMLEAWRYHAEAARRSGRVDVARRSYEAFLARSPTTPQAKEMRRLLDTSPALRGDGSSRRELESSLIWSVRCAPCHGPGGRGDGPMAGTTSMPDFSTESWQHRRDDTAIMRALGEKPVEGLRPEQLQGLLTLMRTFDAVASEAPQP